MLQPELEGCYMFILFPPGDVKGLRWELVAGNFVDALALLMGDRFEILL